MNLRRIPWAGYGLCLLLTACVSGHYIWTLTPNENIALSTDPGALQSTGHVSSDWTVVCLQHGSKDEDPCTVRAAPESRDAEVLAWPVRGMVAAYSAAARTLQLQDADGRPVAATRCFAGGSRPNVCVFEGAAGQSALGGLKVGRGALLAEDGHSRPLPGNYAVAEKEYARMTRLWLNVLRMDPAGSGGAGM